MYFRKVKGPFWVVAAALCCFLPAALSAQMINEIQFVDKPIREILTALGQMGGKTILVDDTVAGNATHYIKGKTFDQALQIILDANQLYAQRDGEVIIVSRVNIQLAGNLISVSAEQVNVEALLRRLARAVKRTILYEPLPSTIIDINLNMVTVDAALNIILKRLRGFTLENVDQSFFIKAVPDPRSAATGPAAAGQGLTVSEGGIYSLNGKTLKVNDLVERLFTLGKREYSMMKRSDAIIDRANYSGKTFDQMLRLILELSDGDYTIKDNIYYILDTNRNNILKKFDRSERIQLRNLSVNQIMNLLPSNLLGGNVAKVDKASNSVLLSGSSEELGPVATYIRNLDQPPVGMEYTRFECRYIPAETVPGLLPEGLKVSEPIILKAQNSLIMLLSPALADQVKAFLDILDKPKRPQIIALKYIRADDLMAKLPSFLSKDTISVGPDQRYAFFTGSPEQFSLLQEQMKYIDLPVPQIKYQVLIVQYTNSSTTKVTNPGLTSQTNNLIKTGSDSSNGSGTNSGSGSTTGINIGGGNLLSAVGTIGQLTGIDLSLITSFGMNFLFSLSAQVVDNNASILANTTLNALSNQDVSFRNTTTTRYRDQVVNTDTGTTSTTTGTVREVQSGLIVTMKGWVSGDGMVTMTISTTFSKASPVTTKGDPPGTFEKIFTTTVRSPSGKAVILGGLMEAETENTKARTPGVSDIVVVGELFKGKSEASAKTELMIYVIPRVENPMLFDAPRGDAMLYIYKQHAIGADDGAGS